METTPIYTPLTPKDAPVSSAIITTPPETDDPLFKEQNITKSGKTQTQYGLYVKVNNEIRKIRFLWNRQIDPLTKAFGTESKNWVGKEISISKDENNGYANLLLVPIENIQVAQGV